MNLKNKIALITGGARIGLTIAEELAKQDCHVVMTYWHSQDIIVKNIKKIQTYGTQGLALKADVRRTKDLHRVMTKIKKNFGSLDILINMASVYKKTPYAKLLHNSTSAGNSLWQHNIDTDLKSAYSLSLLSAPLMQKKGWGRIINFTDWVAASGRPRYKDRLPYYVAKTGIKGLTESLALELAPHILVNALALGPILPQKNASEEDKKKSIQATPLKKWGNPMEVAKAVLFLIDSDFITGECLRIDGGKHLL